MTSLYKLHKAVDSIANVDRISHLQDDLLYHILSFLNVFDAVQTALLSKRWKSLCLALPFLDIDLPNFCHGNLYDRDVGLSSEQVDNFKDFINWVLTSRSAPHILRLTLSSHFVFSQDRIFRWMCIAARRYVQELIVTFDPLDSFCLPFSLVNAHSLRILKLHLFGRALQLPDYPGFLNLESLCLEHIKFTDEYLTRRLFSGCPSLNKLVLNFCTFENIKVFHISSFSLQLLFFEDGEDGSYRNIDLKVSCPNLLAFKYGAPAPRQYIFEGISSLEKMHIHPVEYHGDSHIVLATLVAGIYGALKMANKLVELKLGIYINWGLREMGKVFRCSLCSFHGLKVLSLLIVLSEYYMPYLNRILEHCPNLEALTLYLSQKDEVEDLSKITCVRTCVKYVNLFVFEGEEDEIELARTILECGIVLKKFVLCWSRDAVMDSNVADRILGFPKSSTSVEIVFVDPDPSTSFEGWLSM